LYLQAKAAIKVKLADQGRRIVHLTFSTIRYQAGRKGYSYTCLIRDSGKWVGQNVSVSLINLTLLGFSCEIGCYEKKDYAF
jgi:hypothetical protein